MSSTLCHIALPASRTAAVLSLVLASTCVHGSSDLHMSASPLSRFDLALDKMAEQLPEGASADHMPGRIGISSAIRMQRSGLDAIALAEVDEQLRRPESQSAFVNTKGAIAVIYPDLGEPYRSVFAKIIEGIEHNAKAGVRSYSLGPNTDINELHALLKRDGVKVVIALGRQGLKAAGGLQRDMAVVVGGILAPPDAESRKLSGVSLTPDPALLFARLKNLMPGVRRVIVVYDPQQNEWLIKLAHDAARSHGLELLAQEAPDLKTAARLYETAFTAIDGRRDALWLPQDATTVDEATVLPLVLRESWNRGVPIFSSSILHVKKGALFALYPDNFELGRTLGSSALSALAGDARRGMTPLRELHTAVNLRTAGHVGLNIDVQQQRSFNSVFPEH